MFVLVCFSHTTREREREREREEGRGGEEKGVGVLVGVYICNVHVLLLSFREGDLRVIRPFVYVREKDLRAFADSFHLPVIAENCPACFEAPKVINTRLQSITYYTS